MDETVVNSSLVDASGGSNETTEISCQEQTLPIFQKIEDLAAKVHDLRKKHAALSDEVKGITPDSFPGSEAISALRDLSMQHELLKRKYEEECNLLKKRYLDECTEKKRLYNEVIELKGNIRVFCRCRPSSPDEVTNGSSSVVDFDLSHENEIQIVSSDSSRKQFRFDHVFKPNDSQEAVFVETMPMVTSVLDGYNVCIFAYGQTGTGKTFTMEGTPENRGVNYRTLEKLFSSSSERSSIIKYELFVSMLEVYNDKIRDLLIENSNQPTKKLEVKQSAEGTQEVPGLVEARVYGTDEVWELLQSGSRARSVGSTNANELSSRSHCLLRVTVIGENVISGQRTRSHLWLVDLAGSERVGRIEAEGERLKESQFINKSLSALGDVISALAAKTVHVPYRNSKLTHILQSSLGGDCKTLMFVQISPSASDLGETLCSLNFASRVRGVEQGPARRQTDFTELNKYKQMAEKSKQDEKEMKKLQDSMHSLQLRLAAREHISRNLQEKVRDLENKLAEERKVRLKQENRALAVASNQSSSAALPPYSRKMTAATESKPPLAPLRSRFPLQKITNLMPQQSSIPHQRARSSFLPTVREAKENAFIGHKTKAGLKSRRGSIAVKPSPPQTRNLQVKQPLRRASMATLRPELNMVTPVKSSAIAYHHPGNKDRPSMGRQSFVWDPQRVWRRSGVPSPQVKEEEKHGALVVEAATPVGPRCSKFVGSPPSQQPGSWRPKLPTVVALKKQIVWSPLKTKVMRSSNKKSFGAS